jgi:polyisoprenoid-binding protein YceI
MRAFQPRLLAWSLLLTCAVAAQQLRAETETFAIDPVHTRIGFQVSHAGFSSPLGSFSGSHGQLRFDEADWSTGSVDVTVPVATLELGDADWNRKILDPTFFDAKKFPEAHFVSTRVEKTGERTARITGELTLLGRTHPIVLDATFNALKRHPLTLRRTAGFSATATISRAAFGMDAWKNLVGDEVRLVIEIEATRQRGDAKETGNADTQ